MSHLNFSPDALPFAEDDSPESSGSVLQNEAYSSVHIPISPIREKLLSAYVPLTDPTMVCPFNLPLWDKMSANLYDPVLRDYVSDGLHNGFRLKYTPGPLVSAVRNNPSAYKHKEVVSDYLLKELARGSVAGPFIDPPFDFLHISRFGVIPKSEEDQWRMILDLSFPSDGCVNMGISDEDAKVSYEGLDFVIDNIIQAGRGCFLSKFDIQAAYRNIPVHPDDRYLLGMRWEGFYFVDLALSFGGRSAPGIFTSVADVLTQICLLSLRHSFLSHYLDDFIQIVAARYGHRIALKESHQATDVLHDLGVPVVPKKTIRATNILPHLGVILDTLKMEARLSSEKLAALDKELASWNSRRSGTKRDLLSLIGKLMYATQVVHHGRPFLRRLINKASALKRMHFRVHLSVQDREDLRWWQELLINWNGVSLFSFRHWEFIHDLFITSDAAQSKGLGIIYKSHWCSVPWPAWQEEKVNIAILELIPVIIAAHTWGSGWHRRKILFRIDNSAVVDSLNSGLPRDRHLAFLVRHLSKLAVIHSFRYRARHLPGKENPAADALSRLNVNLFKELMPSADTDPTEVSPDFLLYLLQGSANA